MTGSKIGDLFVQIRTKGLKASMKGIAGFGAAFGGVAGIVTAGTQVIIGAVRKMATAVYDAFKQSVISVAGFEYQMAKVATLMDKESLPLLGKFKDEVLALSDEFGKSTADLTEGFFKVKSASIADADAITVLRNATMLATGGFTSVKDATAATIAVMKAYNIEASEAGDVTDFLTVTAKLGIIDMTQLASRIGLVAGQAASTGMSMEELGAAISAITVTIPIEQGITGLRAALRAFTDSTPDAIKAAGKFGVAMTTTALRTDGLLGVLTQLKKGGATADDIAKIFTAEARMAITPLFDNLSRFGSNVAAQSSKAGAAADALSIAMETLATRWNRFSESVNNLKIRLGTEFLADMKEGVDWLIGKLPDISKWIKSTLIPAIQDAIETIKLNMPEILSFLAEVKTSLSWIIYLARKAATIAGWGAKIKGAIIPKGTAGDFIRTLNIMDPIEQLRAIVRIAADIKGGTLREASFSGLQKTVDSVVANKLDETNRLLQRNEGPERAAAFGPEDM